MSFSMLYFSKAWVAQSTASWVKRYRSKKLPLLLSMDFKSYLLHLLGHVRILDHCLPVRHLEAAGEGFSEAQLGFKGSEN